MIIFIAKRLGKKVDLPEGGWFNTEADEKAGGIHLARAPPGD